MSSAPVGGTGSLRGANSSRQRTVAVLVLILGLVLVAHPLYLWPHYGQTQVSAWTEEPADPSARPMAFSDLPPPAQDAFRTALEEGRVGLWTGEDDRVIETFADGPVVRYRGTDYQVLTASGHGGPFIPVFLRWVLTAVGALLVGYGAMAFASGSWRPFTPVRSLVVPVAVTTAFLGTAWYDVALSGAAGSVVAMSGSVGGLRLLQLIPIGSTAFVAGSTHRSRRGRNRVPAAIGVGVLVIAYGRYRPSILVSGVILTVYAVVAAVPWAGLGYWLTAPD